jgi:hypothetical protein
MKMGQSAKPIVEQPDVEPVRILGRGLRAKKGVRLTLRTVREAVGKTQVDVSRVAQMNQGDVSRLEARSDLGDCRVGTLRRYIEALGGELELVARFGDKRITVVGVEPTAAAGGEVEPPAARRQNTRRGRSAGAA